MAESGYNWGAYSVMNLGAGSWTPTDLADTGTTTGGAVSLDGIAACEVGITAAASNTAVDGVATVYILGTVDGTNYEGTARASYAFSFTPVQSTTIYKRFSVDPFHFGAFKMAIFNDSGAKLTLTCRVRTATIPAAS